MKICPRRWRWTVRRCKASGGVHFHVPIYVQRFGRLEAMQGAILDCLHTLPRTGHRAAV